MLREADGGEVVSLSLQHVASIDRSVCPVQYNSSYLVIAFEMQYAELSRGVEDWKFMERRPSGSERGYQYANPKVLALLVIITQVLLLPTLIGS